MLKILMLPRILFLSLAPLALHAQSAVEILHEVDLAESRQRDFRARQSYMEEQRNWRLDENGQRIPSTARSKTFVVRFRDGARYRDLVARDGRLLDVAEAALQQAQAKPIETVPALRYSSLALTHRLSYSIPAGAPIILEATPLSGEGKRHVFLIDSATRLLLEHTVESVGPAAAPTRTVSRFALTPDGRSLLTSVEIDFVTELNGAPYRGLQIVSYSLHRAAPQS